MAPSSPARCPGRVILFAVLQRAGRFLTEPDFCATDRVYDVKLFPTSRRSWYIRRFCSELAKFPDKGGVVHLRHPFTRSEPKYIYSPHVAPLDVQNQAGCIGQVLRFVLWMKAVFGIGLYGANPEVLDDTAGDRRVYIYAPFSMDPNKSDREEEKTELGGGDDVQLSQSQRKQLVGRGRRRVLRSADLQGSKGGVEGGT